MSRTKPLQTPLDVPSLERLALRYVERFATTRARLKTYLDRKLRARGFDGEWPDTAAIAERFAGAGYVDDRAFGEARAAAMARRGLGARRVAGALNAAGIDEADRSAIAPAVEARAEESAMAYARKRRFGPFASEAVPRDQREKQIGSMIRAGHDVALARRIVGMAPGTLPDDRPID